MFIVRPRCVGLVLLGTVACNNPAPPSSSGGAAGQAGSSHPVAGAEAKSEARQADSSVPAASTQVVPEKTSSDAASHEFRTQPVPEGYQRFEPTAVELDPGDSKDWAQWVGGPLDQDYDVIDIKGVQSIGGHHALVYATTVAERPGTTRLWKEEDQITSRLMGGIGGEGGASVQFPPGVVFRVKKGSYILLQTHFLNATNGHIVGRTVMDIKLAPVDESRTVASMFSSTSVSIKLAAHEQSSMDIGCPIGKDLKFLQTSNHMHDYGTAQLTQYVDASGATHVVQDDKTWAGEQALNPNFTKYTVESPLLVPKGSMLQTHCTWMNTTDNQVTFPTEMCVFFGFILNENDIYCTDGKWSESKSFGAQPAQMDMPSAGAAGATGATGAIMPAASTPAANSSSGTTQPMAASGCKSDADQAIMKSDKFDGQSTQCATPCALDPDVAGCAKSCLQKDVGLSAACATCNGDNIACGAKNCLSDCLSDSASPACRSCVMTKCDPAFRQCTGT